MYTALRGVAPNCCQPRAGCKPHDADIAADDDADASVDDDTADDGDADGDDFAAHYDDAVVANGVVAADCGDAVV